MGCTGSKRGDPFVEACKAASLEEVRDLCHQVTMESRIDGLVTAVDSDQKEVVKILHESYGSHFLQKNSMTARLNYHSAVTMASASRQASDLMLRFLLRDAEGNPNSREPISQKTALHFASAPHLQTVKVALLSEAGADINALDKMGRTPLDGVMEAHSGFDHKSMAHVVDQFRHALGDRGSEASNGPGPPPAAAEPEPVASSPSASPPMNDHALDTLDSVLQSIEDSTTLKLNVVYSAWGCWPRPVCPHRKCRHSATAPSCDRRPP
eukprot:TRINITY_DN15750_c0_g1_i2.p1 TRINITY_DN15750_c0_g1~~TRINITY_DN15750_c0_g1_i2.p1  ORF type:complete len:267 (-),score=58.34 TRINITY_DN15750_c0_g1_i2:317-1117(-)